MRTIEDMRLAIKTAKELPQTKAARCLAADLTLALRALELASNDTYTGNLISREPDHYIAQAQQSRQSAGQQGEGASPLCSVCGKPKEHSRHIKYGNDVNNPVKHYFTTQGEGGGE